MIAQMFKKPAAAPHAAALGVALGLLAALLALLTMQRASLGSNTPGAAQDASATGGEAYVLRFDPALQSYEVFTVPTQGAQPWDVALRSLGSHVEVWITESGADQIGRLTYTDTHDTSWREYPLVAGSGPLNLSVAGDGQVWFTAPRRNCVGRLDPQGGQVVEFAMPTPGSRPVDLALASNSSMWISEMDADQIAHLVVSLGDDYAVTEYANVLLAGGRPYGIALEGSDVFVAQTANDWIQRFTPPSFWVSLRSHILDIPDEPYELARSLGRIWATERAGNRVSSYDIGTFLIVNSYDLEPEGSLPIDIAVGQGTDLWVTQWAAGQIARLTVGIGVPTVKSYYSLPTPELGPTGIAVDSAGMVWIVASRRLTIYLPQMILASTP
jgi:streptogramin lyase